MVARIAEENLVGERDLDEPLGKLLLPGDPVEVGGMPELARLLGQRRDKPGVGMAEHIDGNPGGKVEKGLVRLRIEPGSLAARENEVLARVRAHDGCGGPTSARVTPDRHWSRARLGHRGSPSPKKSKRPPVAAADDGKLVRGHAAAVNAPHFRVIRLFQMCFPGMATSRGRDSGIGRIDVWLRRHLSRSRTRHRRCDPCRRNSSRSRFWLSGHDMSRVHRDPFCQSSCPARVNEAVL